MDKRYQVFVSSTYQDLQDERQEVMQALLELDCIPSGMELFPAANEDQWTLIKKVIDDCDYYLVIVAGRYGSLGPDGQSYTEMEYRYALEQGKPVIGFLHRDPGSLPANRCETTEDSKTRLNTFREFVQKKMCRHWDSPADLGSQVSRSLIKLIKNHPAVGWVRGDLVPEESAAKEILGLRKQIEALNTQLAAARTIAPEGTEHLSQGDEAFEFSLSFKANPYGQDYNATEYSYQASLSWNQLFAGVSPLMIDEASDADFRKGLNATIQQLLTPEIAESTKKLKGLKLHGFAISAPDFQTVKIQLRALGLIARSSKPRSVKDTSTYWTLTPYGDNVMTRLRAIGREAAVAGSEP